MNEPGKESGGLAVRQMSVTALVRLFSHEFDAPAVAERMAEKDKKIAAAEGREPKIAAAFLNDWEIKKINGAREGKRFHAFAAALINGEPVAKLEQADGRYDQIALLANRAKKAQAKLYAEQKIRAEFPGLQLYGRADLIMATLDGLRVVDWKFTPLTEKDYDQFKAPLQTIAQNKLNSALIQCALYRVMLEQNGNRTVAGTVYQINHDDHARHDVPQWADSAAREMIAVAGQGYGDREVGGLNDDIPF